MLPPFYEVEDAVAKLDSIVTNCELPENEEADFPQFSNANLDEYEVAEFTEPRGWRLSMMNDLTGEALPVRMRLQGIISDLDLPPVRKPTSTQAMERMRRHIRQGIMLTGCNSEAFYHNIEQMERLQVKFSGALPPNSLKDWQPTYEGANLVIDMHNRYFIQRSLAPNRPKAWFDYRVDPEGVLEAMQRDMKFIHLDDNRVEYYSLAPANSINSGSDVPANPTLFRIGDIVETIVEFAAFPAGNNQFSTVVILKAVKMITPDYRNSAEILAMRSRYKPTFNWRPQIKRKSLEGTTGHNSNEVAERATKQKEIREIASHDKQGAGDNIHNGRSHYDSHSPQYALLSSYKNSKASTISMDMDGNMAEYSKATANKMEVDADPNPKAVHSPIIPDVNVITVEKRGDERDNERDNEIALRLKEMQVSDPHVDP